MEFKELAFPKYRRLLSTSKPEYEIFYNIPFKSPGKGSVILNMEFGHDERIGIKNVDIGIAKSQQLVYGKDIAKSTSEKMNRKIKRDMAAAMPNTFGPQKKEGSDPDNMLYKEANIIKMVFNKAVLVQMSEDDINSIIQISSSDGSSINYDIFKELVFTFIMNIKHSDLQVSLTKLGFVTPGITDNLEIINDSKFVDLSPSRVHISPDTKEIYKMFHKVLSEHISLNFAKYLTDKKGCNCNIKINYNKWWW